MDPLTIDGDIDAFLDSVASGAQADVYECQRASWQEACRRDIAPPQTPAPTEEWLDDLDDTGEETTDDETTSRDGSALWLAAGSRAVRPDGLDRPEPRPEHRRVLRALWRHQ